MAKKPNSSTKKAGDADQARKDVIDAEVVKDTPAKSQAGAEKPSAKPKQPAKSEVNSSKTTKSDTKPPAPTQKSSIPSTKTTSSADASKDDAKTTKKDSETKASPPPTKQAEPQGSAPEKKSGGFFGPVLGGVIAGALGFGASMLIFPDGWREQNTDALRAMETELASQSDRVAQVSEAVSTVETSLSDGVTTLQTADTELGQQISALSERIEQLTTGDGATQLPDDVQILLNAQKEEISGLRAEVAQMAAAAKAQMDAAAAQQVTAEEAEARVAARGAMQNIRLALLSGDPFAQDLPLVSAAVDIPDGLAAVAEEGVPTSAEIQGAFPASARRALSVAVREDAGSDTTSRLRLFLQDQLSARSLTPQEGDDPDAVLSRAEAAVKAEDYSAALDELEALPEVAQNELADWRSMAEMRQAAVSGFDAVSDALSGN